ncbi:MAG: S8 family serine peptidase [Gammaproteobacteria bacterium]
MQRHRDVPKRSLLTKTATTMVSGLLIAAAGSAAAEGAALTPSLDNALPGVLTSEQGFGKEGNTATYLVLLNDAPVSMYEGGTRSMAATSLAITGGDKLDTRSDASQTYARHLRGEQDRVLGQLRAGEPVHRYVFGMNGFALRMSAADAAAAAKMPGVKSVQRDMAYELTSDRGPLLIGAPSIWEGTATGVSAEGEGMVVGIMDSGINQGHPSFAEVGGDGYGANGEYADTNPFGAGNFAGGDRDDCVNANFPGLCNNKLIGSHSFIDAWDGIDQYAPPEDPVSKDTDGHGTHVASTAAGNRIPDAPLTDADGNDSGVSLGTVSGVAPHAHIIAYKVCAPSCFASDIAAAIDQAILDGADSLNHSIGAAGGSPWADFKSLAFKGARAAGIMLQNSAGNSGPDAGSAGRINSSPWATGVAASTHDRSFPEKALESLTGGDTAAPADLIGRSVTAEFAGPIVYAGDFPVGAPGDTNFDQPEQCLEAFPPGTFTADQIVVCDRGAIARVQKARNVRDGGAGAMVLANIQGGATSTNDDVHVIPAIHINADDGDALRAWLSSGADHSGSITATGDVVADPSVADALAGFSSRGPYTGFDFLSPHVAAPGSAIYAAGADLQFEHQGVGNDAPSVTGEWGIISGTSMASPHATGAATLLKQLRPELTAAEVASILMTTGVTDMRKEDNVTPADVFDFGGGRVDLDAASRAALSLDETIANFDAADPALGGDPARLNVAHLVSNTCVLNCEWTRTVTNVSADTVDYTTSGVAADGMIINVSPASFSLAPGATQALTIAADTTLADAGWNFGEVVLTPAVSSRGAAALPEQHIPVAALFTTATNEGIFTKAVSDGEASDGQTITYELNLTNVAQTESYVLSDPLPANTQYVEGSASVTIDGGTEIAPFALDGGTLTWAGTLDTGGINVVGDPFPPAGSPFGYVDLANFVAPLGCSTVCDDTSITLNGLPSFTFAGSSYTDIIISSNGFIIAGTDADQAFANANQQMPDPAAPNTVIAPFWTDLDLDGTNPDDTGAGNIYAGAFNGGQFIVIEWQGVEVWNEPGVTYTFQIQIGTDSAPAASQGVWMVYNALPTIPAALTVGAESGGGLFGDNYYYNGDGTAPITGDEGDVRVDSAAGGTAVFTFDVTVDGAIGDSALNIATVSSGDLEETAIAVTGIAFIDGDEDGVEDFEDNCLAASNASQCDSDTDGFGNHCDADFNDDGFVNFADLGLLRVGFMGASDAPEYNELDLNCDGAVNAGDLGAFKTMFGSAPGPSANE